MIVNQCTARVAAGWEDYVRSHIEEHSRGAEITVSYGDSYCESDI